MSLAIANNGRVPASSTGHGYGAVMISVALFLLSSCAAAPVVPKCSHIDVQSMGPENEFRVSVTTEGAPTLATETDRMDVAFTIIPPIVGPVVLVKTVGGQEAARWELKVGPGAGIGTRCRLGTTPALSTCGATISQLPFSTAGEWSIEPGDNRVLEAGLSLRVCR